MSVIMGIDPGLDGAISNGKTHLSMPTYTIITKQAITVYARDAKGNKVMYKSGILKGKYKSIIKTPAKTKRHIDVNTLYDWLSIADVIVVELPGTTVGNSAKSTFTTQTNWGKVMACAELSGAEVITVSANKWKADLGLTKDKLKCVQMAEELTNESFRTERGSLLDGQAEAYLIGYWYINYKLKEKKQ